MAAFFPSGVPKQYSYYKTIRNEKTTIYSGEGRSGFGEKAGKSIKMGAVDKLNLDVVFKVKGVRYTSLDLLKKLIEYERRQENAFFTKYGFPKTEDSDTISDMIEKINSILGSEEVFRRNLNIIAQALDEGADMETVYHDISTFLPIYIDKYARQYFLTHGTNMRVNKALLEEIVRGGIREMANATDYDVDGNIITHATDEMKSNNKAVKAFLGLVNLVNKWRMGPELAKWNELLNLSKGVQKIKKDIKSGKTTTKMRIKTAVGTTRTKGLLYELVDGAIMQMNLSDKVDLGNGMVLNLNIGEKGNKTDNLLIFGEGLSEINLVKDAANSMGVGYDRAAKEKEFNQFINKVKNVKADIIFVSNKNYTIRNSFEGFEAGSQSLKNLGNFLNTIHSTVDVQTLTNYLANVGGGRIIDKIPDSLLESLEMQVANFMFDGVTFSGKGTGTGMHVLSLSGIYVPLSAYLLSVYNALKNMMSRPKGLVNVTFSPYKAEPPTGPNSNADWELYRNEVIENSSINVKFLKDFNSFLNSSVTYEL